MAFCPERSNRHRQGSMSGSLRLNSTFSLMDTKKRMGLSQGGGGKHQPAKELIRARRRRSAAERGPIGEKGKEIGPPGKAF